MEAKDVQKDAKELNSNNNNQPIMSADKFTEIKTEILRRARENNACREQYGRAYNSNNLAELMQVVKDNFNWACANHVITPDLIETYRTEFSDHEIYLNTDVDTGFLLCTTARVKAWGNATVEAWGSATVEAYGTARVKAWGNATVEAYGNATVEAWGNAYCMSYARIECKLSGNAIYREQCTNTIYYASDSLTFAKQS